MYGGVADKYKFYKQIGEPFKEKNAYYVMVQPPFSKAEPIKVRFYTDKAHAPKIPVANKAAALCKLFGFKDENDSIIAIRSRDLTKDEVENIFNFNWQQGRNWRHSAAFGGVWYASANEPIPNISRANKVFKCSWPEWKAENAKRCRDIGAAADCIWFTI